MSAKSSFSTDNWSPDLKERWLSPSTFETLTGISLKDADDLRQITRRQRARSPQQNRRQWWLTFIGYSLFFSSAIFIPMLVIAGVVVGGLQLFGVTVSWGKVLVGTGFGSALLGTVTGWGVLDEEAKKQRSLATLFPLIDEMDRYHALLQSVHLQDLTSQQIAAKMHEQMRSNLLDRLAPLQTNLIAALQVERILRDHPTLTDLDPTTLAVQFATAPSNRILEEVKTYQDLLQQTLDLGIIVQQEMESISLEKNR